MNCLQETHFRFKDTNRLKAKDGKWNTNSNCKKGGMLVLLSKKVDFKTENGTRYKEGCF